MNKLTEGKSIDSMIRIALLVLLVGMSVMILMPFTLMLVWGIIIAVAAFPLFKKVTKLFGNRKTSAAVFISIVGILIIVLPSIFLAESSISGLRFIRAVYQEGQLTIPAPTEEVKTWPVVGEKLFTAWDLASHNIREFINKYNDQIKEYGQWILNTLAGIGITIIQFIVSIIIAGILLAKADLGEKTLVKFAGRLVGDRAEGFIKLTTGTIRSVVQGILGIALIQAFASAILLFSFNLHLAGIWAVIIMVLSIMQLPPLLVLGPICVYVFSAYDTFPAVIFTVVSALISVSDSLLKPLMLGRGVDIPMPVILIGAIGGMLVFGILGLFIGAVVLSLSYKLLIAWLHETEPA